MAVRRLPWAGITLSLLLLAATGPVRCQAQTPVFRYLCNETSGSQIVKDYSGNNFDVSTFGGTFDGISCVFDGASSLQLPAGVASLVSAISGFTFVTWIKIATVNNYRYLHMGSDVNNFYYLGMRGGPKNRVGVELAGSPQQADCTSLSGIWVVNAWVHLAISCTSSSGTTQCTHYIDAVSQDTVSVNRGMNTMSPNAHMFIGRDASGSSGSYFIGNLKDIRFYNTALTQSQVLSILMQNPSRAPTFAPTISAAPTLRPTKVPTMHPTKLPTEIPTNRPTLIPTLHPTKAPTLSPTNYPTKVPTEVPTQLPTTLPTLAPSTNPTTTPTMRPSGPPTMAPTPLPIVTVIRSRHKCKGPSRYTVNGNDDLQISASANNHSDFSFTWTTPNASTVTLVSVGPYVGVPAGTFTPGGTYVIDLQLNTGTVVGYKKLVLYVNQPPKPGACDVSPRRGAAFGTVFSLMCTGWSDAEADVPLTYHFKAVRENGASYALSADSGNATMMARLPRSANLTVSTTITDSFGAFAQFSVLNVNTSVSNVTALNSLLAITLARLNVSTSLSLKDAASYTLLLVTTEIERTGGLTGGVRTEILSILDAFISLAKDDHMDAALGEVFGQILENVASPSRVSNLTSWHMSQIVSLATALANETVGITSIMADALMTSVSNAIDAGLLQDKASTDAPPMLDELLNLLTTHALEDMQPGGRKKTYTSKNIVLTVDLVYANFHLWANLPYIVRVPRLGSTFSLRPTAISRLYPHFCDALIASQAAYWLPNKYLPYTLSQNLTLIDGEADIETEALPLTPLSSVRIGTRCKGSWVAVPVANMTRDPIDIRLPTTNVSAEDMHSTLRSMRCPFAGRTAILEATCDYGPTRSTKAQVYCDGESVSASYRCPTLGKCAFWNQTASDWSSRGCETLSESEGSLTCACSHLTSFAVVQDTVQYVGSIILSAGELRKEDIKKSLGLLLVIAAMYACFVLLLVGTRLRRTKESLAYINRIPSSRMFHGVATSLLGVFKQPVDGTKFPSSADSDDLLDGPRAWQEPDTVSVSAISGKLGGTQTAKKSLEVTAKPGATTQGSAVRGVEPPVLPSGATEKDLNEAINTIISRRLRKLEGLKAFLKRAMPCCLVCENKMATVPEEMDSDSYRSPTTRLTAQQSIVIGFIGFVTQLLLAILVTGPNPPNILTLYRTLFSPELFTAPVMTRLMAVSIQQNLVTEPITRLLECVFYVVNKETSVKKSIAETVIERDLPFVDPRPRQEVGTVAMPLLRLCILQLELSLMVLDTSGAHPLSPEATHKLESLVNIDERIALIPIISNHLKRHRRRLQEVYTASVQRARNEVRADVEGAPSLLAKATRWYSYLCGAHPSCILLREYRCNPLEPFQLQARLSTSFDDWVMNELYRHYVWDWAKRTYFWFFVADAQEEVASQQYYFFSWRLLLCDALLSVYLLFVSFMAFLLALDVTPNIVANAILNLVTGVLAQWIFMSRAVTLAQGVLTRRLIAAIEEDMRHSRLGYEAFFKLEQGSQAGAEPLRAIAQYVADPQENRSLAPAHGTSEGWLSTNPLNFSSKNSPITDDGTKDDDGQLDPTVQSAQAQVPPRPKTSQSPKSSSEKVQPPPEARHNPGPRRSKSSHRSSGSRASRGSKDRLSSPSPSRRSSGKEGQGGEDPVALFGDLVQYSLGDDLGMRSQTYLTEQVALQQQRARSPTQGRRMSTHASYAVSPSYSPLDQPPTRSPLHRHENYETSPEPRRSDAEVQPAASPTAAEGRRSPTSSVGNASRPEEEVQVKQPAEAPVPRPRRRRTRSPLRILSADDAPTAGAMGGEGADASRWGERRSESDAWAGKSRRFRVRELDPAYGRAAPPVGRDRDSWGGDRRSTYERRTSTTEEGRSTDGDRRSTDYGDRRSTDYGDRRSDVGDGQSTDDGEDEEGLNLLSDAGGAPIARARTYRKRRTHE